MQHPTPQSDQVEFGWNRYYDALREFRLKEGHVAIPVSYQVRDMKLGLWLQCQQLAAKRGELDITQRFRLESCGVVWDPLDAQWERKCNLLASYRAREGHADVPRSHMERGVKLGVWLNNQRATVKKGYLREERKRRLDELGVNWGRIGLRRNNRQGPPKSFHRVRGASQAAEETRAYRCPAYTTALSRLGDDEIEHRIGVKQEDEDEARRIDRQTAVGLEVAAALTSLRAGVTNQKKRTSPTHDVKGWAPLGGGGAPPKKRPRRALSATADKGSTAADPATDCVMSVASSSAPSGAFVLCESSTSSGGSLGSMSPPPTAHESTLGAHDVAHPTYHRKVFAPGSLGLVPKARPTRRHALVDKVPNGLQVHTEGQCDSPLCINNNGYTTMNSQASAAASATANTVTANVPVAVNFRLRLDPHSLHPSPPGARSLSPQAAFLAINNYLNVQACPWLVDATHFTPTLQALPTTRIAIMCPSSSSAAASSCC